MRDRSIDPSARLLVGLALELRQGLRQIVRGPWFAAAVVVLLALGIGINAATYSVVRNVLLEPLPFRSPEQLTIVWWVDKGTPSTFLGSSPVSGPNFLDWRRESRSFAHLVAMRPVPVALTGSGQAERLAGTLATAGLFEMLQVQPSLGRTFRSDEEQPGRNRVAVISDRFWRNHLAADPQVLGRTLTLDGEPHTVVGVMPPGFQHPSPWSIGKPTEVWIPVSLAVLQVGRDHNNWVVLGRLKLEVTREAAQAEMTALARRLERTYPEMNSRCEPLLLPLRYVLVGRLSGRLWMLLGASTLVLLVVCLNVAGLFVARAMRRQREMAIRAGLGASRGRLVRQSAVEHVPLCALGGAASLAVAVAASRVLRALMPPTIPRIDEIRVDGGMLAITATLSLLVAMGAAIVPALTASRRALADGLRQGRGSAGSGHGTGRRLLVVAQFAVTLMLAHGAALALRSYWNVRTMDTGFSTSDVLTMALDASGPRYEQPEKVRAFFDEAVRRVGALPGVTHAAAINRLPLEGGSNSTATIEGRDPSLGPGPDVENRVITAGYFEAMGIHLVSGRRFGAADGAPNSLPAAVINETMARIFWPTAGALGQHFRFDDGAWLTVVGVVADTRQWGIERAPRPEAYEIGQSTVSGIRPRLLVVRAATDPTSLVAGIRREIARIDEGVSIADVRTMSDVVDGAVAERRFGTLLVGLFAVTALTLVAAAVYALMSFFVARRTPEIGVRMAFGATRGAMLRLVLSNALMLTSVGAAVGLAGVVLSARVARTIVYGFSPNDPVMVTVGAAGLIVVSLAGAFVPALRATRVDPARALRSE